jgi:hypothetical protein
MKEVIELKVDEKQDRDDLVRILSKLGYKTWIKEKKEYSWSPIKYFVIFELIYH